MSNNTSAAGNYHDELWFKVQNRILDSSIWEEDPATRIVFLTLLCLAQMPENRKSGRGVVTITKAGLARRAFITADQLDHAIRRLTAPDPASRTQPSQRIEVLPNGFRIVNFSQYHDCEKWEQDYENRVKAGKARSEGSKRDALGRFSSRHQQENPAGAGEPSSAFPACPGDDPVRQDTDVDVDETRRDETESLDEEQTTTEGTEGASEEALTIPPSLVLEIREICFEKRDRGRPTTDAVLALLHQIDYKHHAIIPTLLRFAFDTNQHVMTFSQFVSAIDEWLDRAEEAKVWALCADGPKFSDRM